MPGNTKKFDKTTVLFTTSEPGLADREQQVRPFARPLLSPHRSGILR